MGSAKCWAVAFKYKDKACTALENFFKRPDTISVGICNGYQLWMELDLINLGHDIHGKMTQNMSGKHESNFISVKVQEKNSIMLNILAGSTLGVSISHGEGKFKSRTQKTNTTSLRNTLTSNTHTTRIDRISTLR